MSRMLMATTLVVGLFVPSLPALLVGAFLLTR